MFTKKKISLQAKFREIKLILVPFFYWIKFSKILDSAQTKVKIRHDQYFLFILIYKINIESNKNCVFALIHDWGLYNRLTSAFKSLPQRW